VGLNVSDKHNMIKLVKVDDKYQGDLQLDSYIFTLLRSIQQTVINLVKEQIKNDYFKGNGNPNLILQLFGGTLVPQIPLLGNLKVHVDGKLDVVSFSKW
jgi:hypothetical protein